MAREKKNTFALVQIPHQAAKAGEEYMKSSKKKSSEEKCRRMSFARIFHTNGQKLTTNES